MLPSVDLPRLTGQMLHDVVHRKSTTAGSLDGWGWKELKSLLVSWFDELAGILTLVEDTGVWPDGLLDAYIVMIPETDGDATPLGQSRIWASTRMVQLESCPLSMMFIVALYLPWCRYLSAQVGVEPQLYADNLKCISGDPDLLLSAAWFTTGYVRLVGQEPAPSKCVLVSTSRVVRRDMKDWVLSQEGDKWSVKFDVRDLGGHLDTTFRVGLLLQLLEIVWLSLVWF